MLINMKSKFEHFASPPLSLGVQIRVRYFLIGVSVTPFLTLLQRKKLFPWTPHKSNPIHIVNCRTIIASQFLKITLNETKQFPENNSDQPTSVYYYSAVAFIKWFECTALY